MNRPMNRAVFAGVFAAAVLAVAPLLAQEGRPEVEMRRPPTILVRPDPSRPQIPLRVVSAKVDVIVVGGLASTQLDLTFANENDRVLEGELVLPLPQGATISTFALEIDGKLRTASVVEREKARVVFEDIVRRGADPGLIEWTKGNSFKARVYPIPARGTKRIVLGYEHELKEGDKGWSSYSQPLAFGAKLEAFACRVDVKKARVEMGDGIPFGREGNVFNCSQSAFEPKDLRFEIAAPGEPEAAIEPARVKAAVGREGDLVFVARFPVPASEAALQKPSRLTLLWDASGSASTRDSKKERAFLEALFAKLGSGTVKLVTFSNDIWSEGFVTAEIKDGKCAEILERIASTKPDGGTRLSCLDLRKLDKDTDAYLLFSDGLQTFGEGDLILGEKPVSCLTSSAAADYDVLEQIAARGALVDLTATSSEEALRRVLESPVAVKSVKFDEKRIDHVHAAPRVDGRTWSLVGKLHKGEATTIEVEFARGTQSLGKATVTLDSSALTETGKVERIWATRAIRDLLIHKEQNEPEVVRLGKAHGLVTPFTSLLVLETLADYVKYHVLPPEEMRDEYFKIVEREKAAEKRTLEAKLAQVRALWKARLAWWKTEFKVPDGFTVPAEGGKGGASGGSGGERAERERLGRPADAPRPAPAPPARDAAPREADGDDAPSAKSDERADKKKENGTASRSSQGRITLKAWDPNTPYTQAFKKAKDSKELYAIYLEQRESNASSTAFFLDAADYFYAQKLPELALRILSNIAELKLESAPLLRILGYRLKQAGELPLAAAMFRTVQRIRPEEPQSFRDLGLVLAEMREWEPAIQNLEKVITGEWHGRFPDIEVIALGELNDVVAKAKKDAGKTFTTLPDDLIAVLDVDVRVILTWDADACDMDLWIVEPSGEKAFYGNTRTRIGGNFGRDFTQGYGPEEYLLKKGMKGAYKIQCNYYGNRQQIIAGDTTIQILIVRNWGRPDESRQEVTRRLKDKAEVLDIAELVIEK